MVCVLTDPTQTKEARGGVMLSLVNDGMRSLDAFTRAEMPLRPLDIADFSDEELVEKVRTIMARARPAEADRELLSSFSSWRFQVLKIESENCGRVETLMFFARKLEPFVAEYAEQARDFKNLATFLDAEWGVHTLSPMPSMTEARRIAYWVSFEREKCSNALRSLDDPTLPSQRYERTKGPPSKGGGAGWLNDYESKEEES